MKVALRIMQRKSYIINLLDCSQLAIADGTHSRQIMVFVLVIRCHQSSQNVRKIMKLQQGYSQTNKIARSLRGYMITVNMTHRYLQRNCQLLEGGKFAGKEEVKVSKMQ